MPLPPVFANITSPRNWTATANVYKDAGTTLCANNDTVQQWNEQNHANNASQATAGLRPVYKTNQLNGLPCVSFLASGPNWLSHTDTGEIGDTFILHRQTVSDATRYGVLMGANNGDGIASAAYWITNSQNGNGPLPAIYRACSADTTGNSWVATAPAQMLEPYILECRITGTLIEEYINGARLGQAVAPTGTSPRSIASPTIGAGYYNGAIASNLYLNGDIFEIVKYDVPLTNAQREQVYAYFAAKWFPSTTTYQWLFPTFTDPGSNGEYFRLLGSNDGITFTEIPTSLIPSVTNAGVSIGAVRDPSIFFWNNAYWLAYTTCDFSVGGTTFGLAKSINGYAGPYRFVVNVDCSAVATGPNCVVWSPIPFFDSDGSLHMLVSIDTGGLGVGSANFRLYHMEPTDLTGLTTWTAPVEITGIFASPTYANVIAGYIVKRGGTYYLISGPNNSSNTNYRQVLWSSSQPFSGYTVVSDPFISTFGINAYEGGQLYQVAANKWRAYADHYAIGGAESYVESTDNWATWSNPIAVTAPFTNHNGIMRFSPTLATSYTNTPPNPITGPVGVASATGTLAIPTGTTASNLKIFFTPDAGCTVTPNPVILDGIEASANYVINASTVGNKTIVLSNNKGMTDATTMIYAATTAQLPQVNVVQINGAGPVNSQPIGPGLWALASGTAQAGSSNTLTLALSDPAPSGAYVGGSIILTGNTGAGQAALISGHVGKVLTVFTAYPGGNWLVNPNGTTTYSITGLIPAVTNTVVNIGDSVTNSPA